MVIIEVKEISEVHTIFVCAWWNSDKLEYQSATFLDVDLQPAEEMELGF